MSKMQPAQATNLTLSLSRLLGAGYIDAVVQAAAYLLGLTEGEARRLADEPVEFFPPALREHLDDMLGRVGEPVAGKMRGDIPGAPTAAFAKAFSADASPVGGLGFYRLGQDGRLYLTSKSEHYHLPLGHNFPGYRLLDNARALGISNTTHNNTRGYITRLCEQELVRCANGLAPGDADGLRAVLASEAPHVLNRVINLETGSIACEAGIKMMLTPFYRLDKSFPEPPHSGKIPVFFVVGDYDGGGMANYHGTSVFAQCMRDMWPELSAKARGDEAFVVCPVAINDIGDFQEKFARYSQGNYRPAGFIHEIVLMNYGGILLREDYLREAYAICHRHGTPVMCDEIQSCMWYSGMFLYRRYGLSPDMVVIGKGFPGGQYPASRILLSAEMDSLNQFGALVTNGQEELASLAYLITMAYVEQNGAYLDTIGAYYEEGTRALAARHGEIVASVDGLHLLSAVTFHTVEDAVELVRLLSAQGIDISAQVYKAFCPPSALLKLPVISTPAMVDWLLAKMDTALIRLEQGKGQSAAG